MPKGLKPNFDQSYITSEPVPLGELSYEPLPDSALFAEDENAPPPDLYDLMDVAPPSTETTRSAKPKTDPLKELRESDLTQFFGPGGVLASQLEGYEMRPSQLEMAQAIKKALLDGRHALVEAPTGTGKSIAYLVPAILSGRTAVIATANKSLQSQLFQKDIPFLRKVMKRKIDAVLVKGRSNFICIHKWENESFEQDRFRVVDKPHPQFEPLRDWLGKTDSGDVDDLPFVIDGDLRTRIVSYPDDCLHQECAFYDRCYVNKMRDRAAAAQVLVTNHHLLLNALELGFAGERLLPTAPIYVVDEAHGLEQTATSVYETAVTDYTVKQLLERGIIKQYAERNAKESELEELLFRNTLAFQEVSNLSRDSAFRIEAELEELKKLGRGLEKLGKGMTEKNPYSQDKEGSNKLGGGKDQEPGANIKQSLIAGIEPPKPGKDGAKAEEEVGAQRKLYELTLEAINSAATKLLTVATNKHDVEFVRYASRVFDRRHVTLEIHAAPLNPAELLSTYLFQPELEETGEEEEAGKPPPARSVICTSATLSTHQQFSHVKARFGITVDCEERVLPAVFDYPKQALLYQPPLPAYDYRNANAFYAAATVEIRRLLEVSRGRALVLFTSWGGLQQVRDVLDAPGGERVIWPLRSQGDAPRDALLTWFKSTPNSVLLATRSFWEGVDIPGDDLSLVVLDKMPFPTPGDPLHSARMKAIDDVGRSSFADYMVPLMTLALKQGFGRLIRRATDQGVVAILDERLSSKSYGRQTRNDLPPARFSREFKDVHKFYQDALKNPAEFGLNVWAGTNTDAAGSMQWRWQLVRLQDGKSDSQQGVAQDMPDAVTGEVFAAVSGLRDLRLRIEKAGRQTDQFSVELRCSDATRDLLRSEGKAPPAWRAEVGKWRAVILL